MKLSILVCSTHTRYNSFLPRLLGQLFGQWEALPEVDRREVEVVTVVDTRSMRVGEKRNHLVAMAKGDYVAFADDDDRVADDYVAALLAGCRQGRDVVTFVVEVSLNGGEGKPCYYSREYGSDRNEAGAYYRLPNHIMCVKRHLAQRVQFKPIQCGEDADYAKRLKPQLTSETKIDRVLYYYDWSVATTEAQEGLRQAKAKAEAKVDLPLDNLPFTAEGAKEQAQVDLPLDNLPFTAEGAKEQAKAKAALRQAQGPEAVCDVVIMSNAKSGEFYRMAQGTVDTLVRSERPGMFNVVVLEQTAREYKRAKTVRMADGEFNYNRFANMGARMGSAKYLCIANNDLVFTQGWFSELLKVGREVMSPKCPVEIRQKNITVVTEGFDCGVHFSGWCFVVLREVWEAIGGFDEDFPFWCADNSVIEQVRMKGYTPVVVPASVVRHYRSMTLKTVKKGPERDAMTRELVKKFNRKYGKNLFGAGTGEGEGEGEGEAKEQAKAEAKAKE